MGQSAQRHTIQNSFYLLEARCSSSWTERQWRTCTGRVL